MDNPQKGNLDEHKMTDLQKNSKKVSQWITENFTSTLLLTPDWLNFEVKYICDKAKEVH